MSRMPDFFIVGAPKCGTTALYAYLRQHPDLFMPFHKEPLYFGSDLTRRYGAMSEADYLSLFRAARPDQLVGEASAWYLYSTRAAEEIHHASPHARVIVMLRNPVDVMYAQHSQLLFSEQEDIPDFAEALIAEPDRVQGRRLPPGPIRPENLFYGRMVRFSEQLQRYVEVFGWDRIHLIIHDDMRRDVAGEYRRVLDFLGVDPTFTPEFRFANENKSVRRRWIQRLIWDPPLLRALIPALRRYPIVHALRSRLLELNSRRQQRALMDPHLRDRLERELAPEVAELGRMLGRDLSGWSRTSDTRAA